MDKIKKICEALEDCVIAQVNKGIENVDTNELSLAIDMIKDMAEVKYKTAITEAMEGYNDVPYHYFDDNKKMGWGGDSKMYYEPHYRMTPEMYKNHTLEQMRDMDRKNGKMYYTEPKMDSKFIESKRRYMENKGDTNKLNMAMNDLGEEIKEMVMGATSEERTMAKQKLINLANAM